ncbi:protein phosphatase CheZ [Zobellella maritima]|uniref:protein phosphatase CheZ n=1 Tax=Zobellella maritima TaxID=2059725 RepID=UPI0018E5A39E|nr:protein phosphatase CheZ [Zobellella maritima]
MGEESRPVTPAVGAGTEDLIRRIGRLTRLLHDSMQELGLDKDIARAATAIPDARDRLAYVATMTEQAAERALNAIDRARPLQNEIEEGAEVLERRWQRWFESPLELAEARELVVDTRAYLKDIPEKTRATNDQLLEILMAQDFQDLTGQVINKMMGLIREIEHQLVQALLDNMPDLQGEEVTGLPAQSNGAGGQTLLNGPQLNADGEDVVSSQDQVDALLDDLGF